MWQNVRDLGETDEPCPACGAPPVGDARHLRPFAIDVSAVEEDVVEVEEIVDADVVSDE